MIDVKLQFSWKHRSRSTRNTISRYRRDHIPGDPCHGHMRHAWDEIRLLGDEEQKIPTVEFRDSTALNVNGVGVQRQDTDFR